MSKKFINLNYYFKHFKLKDGRSHRAGSPGGGAAAAGRMTPQMGAARKQHLHIRERYTVLQSDGNSCKIDTL